MFTAEQVAYALKCSKANVYKHARNYGLGSVKYGRIVFSVDDIEILKERRGSVGRPRQED